MQGFQPSVFCFCFFSFLQYISYKINPDDDEEQFSAPSKEQLDEEKQLLLSFKPVMQKFLHDYMKLQVAALYALQVHCNTKGFPKGMFNGRRLEHRCTRTGSCHWYVDVKDSNAYCLVLGMLLRYFVNLYDMEIIEEEAFLSWKEDVTQEYPGKGKALFQVHK